MDIKDIMTDGKIDGQKMYGFSECSPAESWEDFDILADAINAYIEGLTPQETRITPERLQTAGFTKLGRNEFFKSFCYDKICIGFHAELGFFLEAGNAKIWGDISTMEALSELHKGLTGQPLTWVTPYERTVKELEAMGFVADCEDTYSRKLGDTFIKVGLGSGGLFSTWITNALSMPHITTTAQLRELLALLEGKNE